MNKNILYSIGIIAGVTLFGIFLLQSNKETPLTQIERPTVAATIFPIYDITRNVAGETINVTLMLPAGTSPHTFDPTPKQLKELKDVDIVFTIGHGIDTWIEDIVPEQARIVQLDRNISLQEFPTNDEHHEDTHEENQDEDEHDHAGVDPHYWLDPRNAPIIAETIATELGTEYTEKQATFQENATQFTTEIHTAIAQWEESLSPIKGTSFATLHGAFFYLARFADVNLAATFEPAPGKEPTPKYLAELTKEINTHNITALFNEPQLSFSGIHAFASDMGISLGTLDPIGGTDDRLSYIDLIEYNIRTLITALE